MKKLTTEEKIDYIFNTLKKQENRYKRKIIFRIIFFLIIIAYIYYFYNYIIPNFLENLKSFFTPEIKTNVDINCIKKLFIK